MADIGVVYLVGAGPGAPDLVTVRGRNCIRRADVLVYDRLVHPDLIADAPGSARRLYVGKTPAHHAVPQDAINQLLISIAREGLTVTRLKGGDPFVFGRGGEEATALAAAGIPFEVIPGVSAAVAAPAAAHIPVTDRRFGSAFAVVSGHESHGAPDVDWHAIARLPTLVVLMGRERLALVADRLMTCGGNPETPAAVVARGTWADQRVCVATLQTVAEAANANGIVSPATLIVGEIVRLREQLITMAPVDTARAVT